MALYFGTTEITNIDNLVPQTDLDITDVWFGSTNVYTVWETYEDALPATFNTNGDDMRQYQIYGASGGVGDKTENLFDENSKKELGYINDQGTIVQGGTPVWTYDFFSIIGGTEYTYISYNVQSVTYRTIRVAWYNENKTFISRTFVINAAEVANTVTAPSTAAYARLSIDDNVNDVMFNSGSTALTYAPYGYEVDMSVSDGTNTTTTPIYIGDTALQKDEYVDYGEQKIYRRTENLFDGYFEQGTTGNGVPVPANNRVRSNRIAAVDGTFCVDFKNGENFDVAFDFWNYDSSVLVEATQWLHTKNYITPNNAALVRIKIRKSNDALVTPAEVIDFGMYSGSTAPSTYIPYLQPTDPPVPLPALPTCEGTTIVDYAGSGAVPEKAVFEYRKE